MAHSDHEALKRKELPVPGVREHPHKPSARDLWVRVRRVRVRGVRAFRCIKCRAAVGRALG